MIKIVLVFMMLSCDPETLAGSRSSTAAGTPSAALSQGAPATLPEVAASATVGPAIITTNGDNPATSTATAANDNEPVDYTLLAPEPAPPEVAPQSTGVEPPLPESANEDSPIEPLPATGTE
jgi:hypothetical protein